jgi:alginate O-acetyltransferase complex protein AlgI
MRFNSPIFWCFLVLVVSLLAAMPRSWRRWWLLLVSYLFYASWHWPYLLLLIGCATFTSIAGNWIDKASGPQRRRRGWLAISVNFVVLFLFKYLDWAWGNVNSVGFFFGFSSLDSHFGWVLPLGISFYLFESSSYIFDVVKKREKVHSFWDIQLFIAFFPKLIAGPIMRAKELMPQFAGELSPSLRNVRDGLALVVSGLFVKVALADGIAPAVDKAFARAPVALGSIDVAAMAIGFALQIYLDFSSYSRIAIGAAQLCGIQLVENFEYPFSAHSPVDFWNRWHISLSRWIRDYVYYPLVGGRVTLTNMCKAAVISMTICGIWHGAGWKFVAWGFFHGLLIAGYQVYRFVTRKLGSAPDEGSLRARAQLVLAVLAFNAALLPSWLLFRASDLTHALRLIDTLLTPWNHATRGLPGNFFLHVTALMSLVWLAPFCERLLQVVGAEIKPLEQPKKQIWYSAAGGVAAGVLFAFCLLYLRAKTTFIYFQF